MKAKLISYTDITVPTPPYKTATKVGIVEVEKGKRLLVKIEDQYYNILKVGMEGEVEERKTDFGTFNFFIPVVKREKRRKAAAVTGASRGIGNAIALELGKSGFNVVISDLEKTGKCDEAMKKIAEWGGEAIFVQTDVTNLNQVEELMKKTVEKFGRIDVLVNNAGINIDKLVTTMTPEQWQKVIDVDLTGVFYCTKTALPYMIQQGGGRIVNVSSMSAFDGTVGQANYAAAKGGIISFTKVIAKEYAQYNVLCNAIAPGFIKTRMTDAMPPGLFRDRLSRNPLGRRGEAEEVAKLVRFLVTEGDYITGQVISINAGEYV